jgi:hypothetical protein
MRSQAEECSVVSRRILLATEAALSILLLAVRCQGIARYTVLHLDCARSAFRGAYRFALEKQLLYQDHGFHIMARAKPGELPEIRFHEPAPRISRNALIEGAKK